jgi:hypothetical protein
MLTLIASFLAYTTNAQSKRIVTLTGGDAHPEFEKQVRAELKLRVANTNRYTIGTADETELEVSLVCIDISELSKNGGGVCALTIFYWPSELPGLSSVLGRTTLISGSDPSYIAEQFFQQLVEASTEKELATRLSTMRRFVGAYNNNNPAKN